jgi:hypothetical protein
VRLSGDIDADLAAGLEAVRALLPGVAAGARRTPQPAGLWRLDAVFREGRQAVRPTCVVPLAEPHAVAAVSDRSLVVVHGVRPRALSRIDVTDANLADEAAGKKEERHEEELR